MLYYFQSPRLPSIIRALKLFNENFEKNERKEKHFYTHLPLIDHQCRISLTYESISNSSVQIRRRISHESSPVITIFCYYKRSKKPSRYSHFENLEVVVCLTLRLYPIVAVVLNASPHRLKSLFDRNTELLIRAKNGLDIKGSGNENS
uniref:Uncharacterized protein n=1 Tax=Glossina austeni TaxID=7395 RepID=A0A1A9VFD7_GLOAU